MEQENNNNTDKLETLKELSKKMDIIIGLLLALIPKDMKSISFRKQVQLLDSLKIRPVDISKITGRTQGYVNKELASIRKSK